MIRDYSFCKWWIVLGVMAVFLTPWLITAIHTNVCQLCRSAQLSQQTGSCPVANPLSSHWTCQLCNNGQTTAELPINSLPALLTISAAEMVSDPQFQYQLTEFSSTELLMYNPALNLNLPISLDKLPTLSVMSQNSIIPHVRSLADDELVPFISFVRLWWNDTVTATLPLTPQYNYQLEIYAQHDAPSPIYLRTSINHQQIGILAWERGDETWSSQCLFVPAAWLAETPTPLLTLNYFNDGGTNGDRDAAIGWIRLIPILQP